MEPGGSTCHSWDFKCSSGDTRSLTARRLRGHPCRLQQQIPGIGLAMVRAFHDDQRSVNVSVDMHVFCPCACLCMCSMHERIDGLDGCMESMEGCALAGRQTVAMQQDIQVTR